MAAAHGHRPSAIAVAGAAPRADAKFARPEVQQQLRVFVLKCAASDVLEAARERGARARALDRGSRDPQDPGAEDSRGLRDLREEASSHIMQDSARIP